MIEQKIYFLMYVYVDTIKNNSNNYIFAFMNFHIYW